MSLADALHPEISNLEALETLHIVTECDHEAADLTFLPVVEVEFELVLAADVAIGKDLLYLQAFALPGDAFEQVARVLLVEVFIESHLIAFDDLARRVGQAVNECAVVCDDDQAFALLVEASSAEETLLAEGRRNEVIYRPLVIRIAVATEKALRFVQSENDGLLLDVTNQIAIEDDLIFARGDFRPEFSALAVHAHAPFFDESFCLAAGGDALVREILL